VRNFVQILGAEPAADLLRPTIVASIGPVTAEAAAQYNIQTTIVPAQYTVPAMVEAIAEFFRERQESAR
jgi:uroporphyrinogen III methyltransferase/synthase